MQSRIFFSLSFSSRFINKRLTHIFDSFFFYQQTSTIHVISFSVNKCRVFHRHGIVRLFCLRLCWRWKVGLPMQTGRLDNPNRATCRLQLEITLNVEIYVLESRGICNLCRVNRQIFQKPGSYDLPVDFRYIFIRLCLVVGFQEPKMTKKKIIPHFMLHVKYLI